MNVTKVYAICLVGCGICCAIMPLFISSFWSLTVIGAAFGLFFASNFSFTPAILVELIPLDRFTTAYGLMLLCQGIGNLLGPPLAGKCNRISIRSVPNLFTIITLSPWQMKIWEDVFLLSNWATCNNNITLYNFLN